MLFDLTESEPHVERKRTKKECSNSLCALAYRQPLAVMTSSLVQFSMNLLGHGALKGMWPVSVMPPVFMDSKNFHEGNKLGY